MAKGEENRQSLKTWRRQRIHVYYVCLMPVEQGPSYRRTGLVPVSFSQGPFGSSRLGGARLLETVRAPQPQEKEGPPGPVESKRAVVSGLVGTGACGPALAGGD